MERLTLPTLRLDPAAATVNLGSGEVVLRDPDGAARAYGWSGDGEHRLLFPGVAAFRFGAGVAEIVAIPDPSASRELVLHAYRSAALPLVLQARGLEALHASAVLAPAGVLAFCAFSGTGKSTVARALAKRGYGLWGDDAVVFDSRPGQTIRCRPIPFGSERAREEDLDGAGTTPPHPALGADGTAPLGVVLVLERKRSSSPAPIETERLPGGEALTALLPHAHRFSLRDGERRRKTMQTYLDLVGRVPVLRVRFVARLEQLPRLLDEIEDAVGASG